MTEILRLRPATPEDLAAVRSALEDFRTHWTATDPTLHQQVPCPFHGLPEDIEALDYLDYEGLRYPPCGVAGAPLVWGNVLVENGPFRWCVDGAGGLVIGTRGGFANVIWPFGRVWESQHGANPQFDKYAWLLASTVAYALHEGNIGEEDESSLRGLVEWIGGHGTEFVRSARLGLDRLERLVDQPSSGPENFAVEAP